MAKSFDYTYTQDQLKYLLKVNAIEGWELLTPGQYRLNDELDIYPKSRRWFFVRTHERGDYEDLIDFVCSIYL